MYEISKSSAQRDVSGRSVIFRIFAVAMEVGGPNFMKCRKIWRKSHAQGYVRKEICELCGRKTFICFMLSIDIAEKAKTPS